MWGEFLLEHVWQFVVLLVLLIGSGFFSGSETALFNLTPGQVLRLRHTHSSVGGLIASLLRRPRRLLNTLLLGNMIVNVAYAGGSATLALSLSHSGAPSWQVGLFSLGPLLLLILCGEVTPKMLAYLLSERWALLAVGPIALVQRGLAPVVWFLDRAFVSPLSRIIAPHRLPMADITSEELAALVDLSAKRGVIAHDAGELLQEVVHLTDLRAADIMVPRVDMVVYDVDGDPAGLAELFRRTRLRKIPVYEGDIDRIIGVVHAKRLLLSPQRPLRELVRGVTFVPEAANAEQLLLQFRQKGTQLAIVVDEYGGTAGLVTLEDVLEELVGDIPDTEGHEEGPPVHRVSDNEYLLDGGLAIHEWADAFGIDLSAARISTIGGFVVSRLGRLPRPGDVVTHRNLRFAVESVRGGRVGRLRLHLLEEMP